jgi:hypothetical protein
MKELTVSESGEAGWRSKLANVAADSMNNASETASIAYSGQ